jgi:hypothetical protein
MLSFLSTTLDSCYNTLSTPNGKESVSLYELKSYNSLPIFNTFYDEVILYVDEFNEADKKLCFFLSNSCKYLLITFHKEYENVRGDYVMTLQD